MSQVTLRLDFETFSELDLLKVGTSRYARHPSTEPLMLAYSVEEGPGHEGPVEQWVPAIGEPMPKILKRELLPDPSVIKSAWNSSFERQIFAHSMGIEIPFEQWRDPMVLAFSLALPGSLEKCGKVVGIAEDKKKMNRGKALIRQFCGYRKPSKAKPWKRATFRNEPEDWEEFLLYNRRDVEAERAIHRKLRKFDMPEHEWDLWHLDQRINEAGLPINLAAVRNAIRVRDQLIESRFERMRKITGLDNPNSPQQLLQWLQSWGEHYRFDDLKKGHVKRATDDLYKWIDERGNDAGDIADLEPLIDVLELRQETSRTAVKKFDALDRATDEEGLLRNTFQFAGAGRTWRWGGRLYQPQNLAKPTKDLEKNIELHVDNLERLDAGLTEFLYDKPIDFMVSCVRPVCQAPKGKTFADADLNAIENRVLGWVADCQKILDVFREGRCPYLDFATHLYHESYDDLFMEYLAGDSTKRTAAKPGVLGCGYMLGAGVEKENRKTGEIEATGLLGYARAMYINLSPQETEHAVKVFRETYDEVVQFWWDIDRAVRKTILSGRPHRLNMLTFDIKGPFLRIGLPSGRHLHYCRPKIEDKMMPWGKVKPAITYEGLNDQKQWVRIQTHPGKLTENVVQAIARDLLAHGMVLADKEGLDIRLHVHDQVVALCDESTAEQDLETLKNCMSVTPDWAPGLPLAAEGFLSRVFKKD